MRTDTVPQKHMMGLTMWHTLVDMEWCDTCITCWYPVIWHGTQNTHTTYYSIWMHPFADRYHPNSKYHADLILMSHLVWLDYVATSDFAGIMLIARKINLRGQKSCMRYHNLSRVKNMEPSVHSAVDMGLSICSNFCAIIGVWFYLQCGWTSFSNPLVLVENPFLLYREEL